MLVVDDEPDILTSLQSLLTVQAGMQVLLANGGREALLHLRSTRVDLVISDYRMPGMSGVELLERAGKMAPHAPRILITAFRWDLARDRGRDVADLVLAKPIDPDALVRHARSLLAANGRLAAPDGRPTRSA